MRTAILTEVVLAPLRQGLAELYDGYVVHCRRRGCNNEARWNIRYHYQRGSRHTQQSHNWCDGCLPLKYRAFAGARPSRVPLSLVGRRTGARPR